MLIVEWRPGRRIEKERAQRRERRGLRHRRLQQPEKPIHGEAEEAVDDRGVQAQRKPGHAEDREKRRLHGGGHDASRRDEIAERQLPVEHPPTPVEGDALIEREKPSPSEVEIDGDSQDEH